MHFKLQSIKAITFSCRHRVKENEREHIKKATKFTRSPRQLNRRHHTWSERWDYTIIKKSETKLFAHWNSHRREVWNKTNFSTSHTLDLNDFALYRIKFFSFIFCKTHSNNNAANIRWENCFSVKTTGCCWFRWITRGEFEAREGVSWRNGNGEITCNKKKKLFFRSTNLIRLFSYREFN